ncbi:structural protein P5 [uncultured Bacteroides sp.]|uniref:structural protein P5 n=1 Tax=uncultured Bacteroides sp. TaxID=162156 RepID=UPI002AA76192|nr:structural protein P5 [uncultured Bacteroides sp.]
MSRGLRNCNPGNIRINKTKWKGEVTPSQDKSFKQFSSMPFGYRSMLKLLQNYSKLYQCDTIRKMISRWAPNSENDTEEYIKTVCGLTGIHEDTVVDVSDKDSMCRIASAMSRVENAVPAIMSDIKAGWDLI